MRLLVLGLLAVAAPSQMADSSASISGVIRVALTSERAIQFSVVAQSEHMNLHNTAYGTTPGIYGLKQLTPGAYRLVVTGFFEGGFQSVTQRSITLSKGQELTLDISVPPPGEITGRVIDEDGRPMHGVLIHAMDKRYSCGAIHYWPIATSKSDELGLFRLQGIPAGRSFVVRADGSTAGGMSPTDTFFSNTVYPDAAQDIVLAAGETRSDVEIRRTKQPSYCVDGVAESGTGFDSMWWEVARSGSQRDQLVNQSTLSASGEPLQKFVICGLHNGNYQVGVSTADLKSHPPQFRSSEGVVVIRGENVHGLRLRPQAPVTVSGEAIWDGQTPTNSSDAKLFVHFEGTLRMGGGVLSEAAVPARFSGPVNLLPEEYIIDRVEVRGGGAYVKDWTWNNQHPPGNRVSLGGESGGGHLRVLVGSDGATISAKVTDIDSRPVSNAFIAMIPASATNEAEMSVAMVSGEADQYGYYSVDAVPPGRYRALAIERVDGATNQVGWGRPKDLGANFVSRLWAAQASGNVVDIAGNAKVDIKLKVQHF